MRSIVLHTAATDNSGSRRAAGEVVTVGSGKASISDDDADDLLARHLCVLDAPEAKPARKPRARKRATRSATSGAASAPAAAKADIEHAPKAQTAAGEKAAD